MIQKVSKFKYILVHLEKNELLTSWIVVIDT